MDVGFDSVDEFEAARADKRIDSVHMIMKNKHFIWGLLILLSCCKGERPVRLPSPGHVPSTRHYMIPNHTNNAFDTVFVSFMQPIGAYQVSVDLLIDDLTAYDIGPAIIRFTKPSGEGFSIEVEDYYLRQMRDLESLRAGQHLVLEMPQKHPGDYLSEDAPFFLSDVDFNGADEIVVALPFQGPRGTTAYTIYEMDGTRRVDDPFEISIDDNTIFNATEQSITLHYYHGAILGHTALKYTRQKDNTFIMTDSLHFDYGYRDEQFYDSTVTHYQRRGDSMMFHSKKDIQ